MHDNKWCWWKVQVIVGLWNCPIEYVQYVHFTFTGLGKFRDVLDVKVATEGCVS